MPEKVAAWIVVIGNPIDGVTHYGPFDDSEDADRYAESLETDDTWWVVKVFEPE